jgi:hypothetical protein
MKLSSIVCAGMLAGLVLQPVLARYAGAAENRVRTYSNDVAFLLTELPKQAGRFFLMKSIDWPAISNEFRLEAMTVTNDVQHVKLCQRLLARLKDGHARLTDVKVALPDESNGRRWTGPRVHLLMIGERVFVSHAFGAAATRGIKAGMEVERIDGVRASEWLERRAATMADETGYSTPHQARYAACHWGLADWEGTPISFDLTWGGRTSNFTIARSGGPNFAPLGPVFPPKDLQNLGRQSYGKTENGFGYIHLRDVPGSLPEQLDTMLAAIGDVSGLILDLRANGGGGCDHGAVFGRFVPTETKWRQYASAGAKPFTGPMVVIVDAGTRSAGETVAGMFKEDGRAYMIGDSPTAGMSSSKTTLPVPSGLLSVYFSVRSNMGRFNEGRGIEGIGVPPHELVPYSPEDLARGVDTQIRRAEELLKQGLPQDKVPFEKERAR